MAIINGWGRGTWGELEWGEGSIPVTLTGLSATSALTAPGVNGQAVAAVAGITATLGAVSVTINADANATPAGLSVSATLPPSANEWTANNGAAISTAQSKFGGASLLLDGVNDNVISNNTYDFQSTAFTVEFWARPANATQDEVLLDTRDSTSNPSIYFRQAGTTLLVGRGTVTLLTVNNVFSANTWVSLAVTRGDPFTNTYTVFVNGNNEGSIGTKGSVDLKWKEVNAISGSFDKVNSDVLKNQSDADLIIAGSNVTITGPGNGLVGVVAAAVLLYAEKSGLTGSEGIYQG